MQIGGWEVRVSGRGIDDYATRQNSKNNKISKISKNMGIFKDLLKVLFLGNATREERLTPEYLTELKNKTLPQDYEKILKEKIVSCETKIMHLQEKGYSAPEVLTDNLQLLKNALAEIK